MTIQQRPTLAATFKKQVINQIFIGIDFGTSYTKVSYSYAPTQERQIHTIKWDDNDFFKKTILYIQEGKLFFDKPDGESSEIKYFKYSVVDETLKNNTQKTKNNFEEMCCVYFLAQVIKRTLTIIKQKLNINNLDDIKISINMGVPLENFYDTKNQYSKGLYLELLEDAIFLAGGSKVKATIPENQVILANLDSVYSEILEKQPILKWNANVYPELAAELLLYHQSKSVRDGVYAIIDIGGGTVDMALFQKKTDHMSRIPHLACPMQRVLPFGVEILQTKPEEISSEEFQKAFAEIMKKPKDRADVSYDDCRKVDVFFLGGGATNRWYYDNIENTRSRLKGGGIPPLDLTPSIDNFINEDKSLIIKNQRLIISQVLARHPDDITDVQGYPDWYEAVQTAQPNDIIIDRDEILRQRYDKYRD